MSTNYYIKLPYNDSLIELFHLGKQSCGWPFLFNLKVREYSKDGDVLAVLRHFGNNIYNEYDERVDLVEFLFNIVRLSDLVKENNKYTFEDERDICKVDNLYFMQGEFC